MYLAALPALESCPQTPRRPGPRMPFGVTAMECDYCNGMPWCPSLFSPYIYTRRPSLLSHTGAVAQCKAMVAVDAMAPLTLTPMGSKTAHCYTPLAPMGSKAKICFTPVANLCCRASGCLCVLEQKSQQICFATGHGCQTEGKAAMQ